MFDRNRRRRVFGLKEKAVDEPGRDDTYQEPRITPLLAEIVF